ncbi:MAG TPA: hypothetical protein VJ843_03935 [Candidatus Saccharimonadales bacterium]|nr:hypothetical protein [Candidatus Saccharimonadales bacterium]
MSVRLSLAGFAALGSSIAFLAACTAGVPDGSTATVTATSTQTSIITVTPTPSSTPSSPKPAPASSAPTLTFQRGVAGMLVHNSDGSEYVVAIKLGALMTNPSSHEKMGKVELGSTCSFNSSTDAVMQYTLIASGHSSDPAVWNLDVRTSTGRGTFPIRSEQYASNTGNLNCVGNDTPIYQNGGSFSSDGRRKVYGYIIIPGYKTAAHAKTKLAHSPLRFKVDGTVLTRQGFGSKQSDGYYLLPLG